MGLEAGQRRKQSVGEAGQPVAWPLLQGAQVELDPDHWCVAEQMRAAIGGDLQHAHGFGAARGGDVIGHGGVFSRRRASRGEERYAGSAGRPAERVP